MGKCKYCGEAAGFLRFSHRECRERARAGLAEIVAICRACMRGQKTTEEAQVMVREFLDSHTLTPELARPKLVEAWGASLDEALDDGILMPDEEARLVAFSEAFALTQQELDHNGGWVRLVKAGVLRDVLEGKLPHRVNVADALPFNFQRSEKLVWLFERVSYLTEKTYRRYVGGSSGVSIRVAKGVYFRTAAFRGRPVETTRMEEVASGMLGVTNKHLYFAGGTKAFRIALPKIVSLQPYCDGLGVMRDGARARPEVFRLDDGWFAYNLVTNLGQLLP